jgi:hypothetical protein
VKIPNSKPPNPRKYEKIPSAQRLKPQKSPALRILPVGIFLAFGTLVFGIYPV